MTDAEQGLLQSNGIPQELIAVSLSVQPLARCRQDSRGLYTVCHQLEL